MKIFEGKSPAERNKIIAALVLGALALLAIGNLVLGSFWSGKRTVNVNLAPTPSPSASPNRSGDTVVTSLPKIDEQERIYLMTEVPMPYAPGAPDAGRNIFAFYEPPIPTPFSPTPVIIKETPTPIIPTPTPPNVLISYISRQSVYAGEKGFRLEVGGDKFTPETRIIFAGSELPTNFISSQQLTAEIPSNFIAGEGQRIIEVRSPDGQLFSNQVGFNIQPQPKPQFQYVGIVSRKRGNNDMAYIQEKGKTLPTNARLNDIIEGRFRLISIAPGKLIVQDVNLGFTHPVELVKGAGQTSSSSRISPGFTTDGTNNQPIPPQCPPGIPCDKLRPYVAPTPQQKKEEDVDDEDGDN